MQPADLDLVLVNRDDELRGLDVTVSTEDADVVVNRTVDLSADERRRVPLDIDEPGTYTVSATVDGDTTETFPLTLDDYALRAGLDGFVEISDGRLKIYWQE